MRVGGLLTALKTSLSGMSNQIKRLDAISGNIANAERAPDAKGKLYKRKIIVPEANKSRMTSAFGNEMHLKMTRTKNNHMGSKSINAMLNPSDPDNPFPVKIKEVEGHKMVYNPSHPRADENGYVKMPNVNPVEEMIDLISASRTYEANVTVLDASKQMAKKALEI